MNHEKRSVAPRVSVPIPVFNGAEWIGRAVRSALEQTHDDLEVVVFDNDSTDATVDIVRSFADERVRLYVNPVNIGFVRNQNRALAHSRGEFVKFLHADDALLPTCIARMLELFDRGEDVAMVFARRHIELTDEANPDLRRWRRTYAHLERGFSRLGELNEGKDLFAQWLAADVFGNWIGEPTSVMLCRSCLARTGLFSPAVRVINDVDLWMHAMCCGRVGFIDEELSVYRAGLANLTSGLTAKQRDWLDLLWVLEGLAAETDALEEFPQLQRVLAIQRRRALSGLMRIVLADPSLLPLKVHDFSQWTRYHAKRLLGQRPRLHPPLSPGAERAALAAPRPVPVALPDGTAGLMAVRP